MCSHRSPPVDQPEDPTVGIKRARMMPRSKIVLPSSDAKDYTRQILRNTISHIVNPTGKLLIPSNTHCKYRTNLAILAGACGIVSREIFRSENCPSWWPKDVAFTPVAGSQKHTA